MRAGVRNDCRICRTMTGGGERSSRPKPQRSTPKIIEADTFSAGNAPHHPALLNGSP